VRSFLLQIAIEGTRPLRGERLKKADEYHERSQQVTLSPLGGALQKTDLLGVTMETYRRKGQSVIRDEVGEWNLKFISEKRAWRGGGEVGRK